MRLAGLIRLPPAPQLAAPLRIAIGPAVALAAIGLQRAMPVPGLAPFVLCSLGTMLASWLAGFGAGFSTVAIMVVMGNYFFLGSYHGWAMSTPELVATALYGVAGTTIALVCGSLRKVAASLQRQTEAHQRTLGRLQQVLAAGHAGTFEWTPDGDRHEWSEELLALYGLPRSTPPAGYDDWLDRVLPEDRANADAAVERARKTGEYAVDFRIRRKDDGEVRWMHTRGQMLFDGARRPTRLFGLAVDVTDRMRVEERLRRSEARLTGALDALRVSEDKFRSVFERAAIGMARVGFEDGRWLDANDALCEMLGYSRDELLSLSWTEVTHAEDIEVSLVPFQRMARGELDTYTVEKRYLHKEGHHFWARLTLSLVRDSEGKPDYELAIVEDIRERRAAEQAVRESEARFRALADNIAQLAWMADSSGRIFWHNQRWFEFTGTTLEEMEGFGWQKVHHPEHVDRVAEKIRRCFETGETWEDTFPLRSRDGSYRWFLSRAVPIRDESSRVVRWCGTNTDVTEQRATEEALRRANERLLEADRRKDEFLAVLSHELRNPLAPILFGVDIIARAPTSDPKVERACEVIRRQSRHMARLIEDLLDVTRISRAKITLKHEDVELDALVRATAEDYREVLAENGVSLQIESNSDVPLWVDGDRVRLAQVVGNLLNNAGKFTTAGGKVVVSLARNDRSEAVIRVRDDGAGMSPEILACLFEPFTQAAQPLARTRGGLGLGLALVKALVEMHGGSVSASSDGEGRGSELAFTVPLKDVQPRVDVSGAQRRLPRRRRVLIIEDNVDAAEILREFLELGEHEVAVATNGREGVEAVRRYRPDLILCDIGLPEMDGYAVARAIRAAQSEAERVLLVALSGYASPEDVARALEAGFDHHIAKPPNIDALEAVLRCGPDNPPN